MSARPSWPQLLAWLVLCAGLAMSAAAYFHFLARTAEDARTSFEEESREAQRAVETRLGTYSSLLLGLRALHRSAGDISADALLGYVGKLELPERFPAVWRMDYVEAPRGRNVPDTFIYPGPYGSGPQFGSGPQLQELGLQPAPQSPGLLEAVRDSNDFVLSRSAVAGSNDIAVHLHLAVHDRHLQIDAPEERRLAFAGSVGMSVSLRQLVKEAVSVRTQGNTRIRIHARVRPSQAVPVAIADDNNLLFDSLLVNTSGTAETSGTITAPPGTDGSLLSRTAQFAFGNALLEFEFSAAPHSFHSPISQVLPAFVLLAGLVISLLLFGLLNSLALSRRALELSVADRTRDLEAIRQALQEEVAGRSRLEQEILHLNVDERRRFGRDLQDNIAQRLTAIGFMLESLAGDLKSGWPDAQALASRIGAHVSSAISHTRMLARGLNPVAVEAGGFISALTRLADSIRDTFRIDCHVKHDGCVIPENVVLQHNLYRIAQQAITNAVTHGKATRIVLDVSDGGRGLRLAIIDNGLGLDKTPSRPVSGLGLEIMRYRCNVLGLNLNIDAAPAGGTAIVIEQQHSKA